MTDVDPYAVVNTQALVPADAQRWRWLSLPILLAFMLLGYRIFLAIVQLALLGSYPKNAALLLCADLVLLVLGVILLCARVGLARHVLALALLCSAVIALDVVPTGLFDLGPGGLRFLHVYPPLCLVFTNTVLWGLVFGAGVIR